MENSRVLPPVICAENIALLSLLHNVVEPRHRNPTDNVEGRQESRYLSLKIERDLTGTLAFLAGISDHPNHIMALCVEERGSSRGLRVMIAINKRRPECGTEILKTVTKGFQDIFAILARISRDPDPRLENEVFSAVISLCRNRILARMRSSKGNLSTNHKESPFLGVILKQVADTLRRTHCQNSSSQEGSSGLTFVIESERLIQRLEELEHRYHNPLQLNSLVQDVVGEIYRLTRAVSVPEALGTISNRDIDPTARERVVAHTKKIARYREAARLLFRLAKNWIVFQEADIMAVHLKPSTLYFPPTGNYKPTLPSSLSRIFNGLGPSKNVHQVCQKLKTKEKQANKCLSDTFERAAKESKIHAEMQLVMHYELNPVPRPPRVISSSKDACYLCNAFINFHGKYHIPRTHGRLYPAWRLPNLETRPELQVGFNEVLHERIRRSVNAMLSSKHRALHPHPNESTISSLAMSDSTVQGIIGSPLLTPPQTPADPSPSKTDSDSEGISLLTSSDDASDISSGSNSDVILVQGTCFSDRVKANRPPLRYSANGLELLVELEGNLPASWAAHHVGQCSFNLEWLQEDKALQVAAEQNGAIINTNSLSTTKELTISTRDGIYMAFGPSIIRIQGG
ncbi:uncharacterized protein BP5553_00934 [Venustampulla echinocandica]|uniref:Uncharacterized protein n=1 Tax=Venustampulla echinocandica TaxID=2656787 RepID=A0A370TZL3_9HELO|nr:uncharacterized protein BP5553_00934 [Venustampulla echinocandica]RDL40955.1 hypothetical protein BP5553_00934 [Venustampulla echinocandica]